MVELIEHSVFGWPWVVCIICEGSGFLRDKARYKRRGICCWGCGGGGAQHLKRAYQILGPSGADGRRVNALLRRWKQGAYYPHG